MYILPNTNTITCDGHQSMEALFPDKSSDDCRILTVDMVVINYQDFVFLVVRSYHYHITSRAFTPGPPPLLMRVHLSGEWAHIDLVPSLILPKVARIWRSETCNFLEDVFPLVSAISTRLNPCHHTSNMVECKCSVLPRGIECDGYWEYTPLGPTVPRSRSPLLCVLSVGTL